ncbi:MAG: hypothetical protein ACOZQL_15375 [Myxococcota bacterium]
MSHDGAASMHLSDTSPRARERYLERLRATPPNQKLARAFALSNRVRAATMTDVRRQHPTASDDELAVAFIRRVYGEGVARRFEAQRSSRRS